MAPHPLVVFFRPLAAASLAAALPLLAALAGPPAARAADPYPEAVDFSRKAAKAVLNHEGRETCLRGKLTKALLKLSDSCDATRQTNPLCTLAGKAAVVTPMSLTFMEDTSRQLLELSGGGQGTAKASRAPLAAEDPIQP
ncbi:MAG: hypothetical protein ACKOYK_00540 [Cyanobium sp.]